MTPKTVFTLFILAFCALLAGRLVLAHENPLLCHCLRTWCMVDSNDPLSPLALSRLRHFDAEALPHIPASWHGVVRDCMEAVGQKRLVEGRISQIDYQLQTQGFTADQRRLMLSSERRQLQNLQDRIAASTSGEPGAFGHRIRSIVLIADPHQAALPSSGVRLVPACGLHQEFAAHIDAIGDASRFAARLDALFAGSMAPLTPLDEPSTNPWGRRRRTRYYRISPGRVRLRSFDLAPADAGGNVWRARTPAWELQGEHFVSVADTIPQQYIFAGCIQLARDGIDFDFRGTPGVSDARPPTPPPAPSPPRAVAPPRVSRPTPPPPSPTFADQPREYCRIHGNTTECRDFLFRLDTDAFCEENPRYYRCEIRVFERMGQSYCLINPHFEDCDEAAYERNPEAYCRDASHAGSDRCFFERSDREQESRCLQNPEEELCYWVNAQRFCLNNASHERCQFRDHADDFCRTNSTHYLCQQRAYQADRTGYCLENPSFYECRYNAYQADHQGFCSHNTNYYMCQMDAFTMDPSNFCRSNPHFYYCVFPDLGQRVIDEALQPYLQQILLLRLRGLLL